MRWRYIHIESIQNKYQCLVLCKLLVTIDYRYGKTDFLVHCTNDLFEFFYIY